MHQNRIKGFFTDRVNDALRKDENLEFAANELEKRIGTRAFKQDHEPLPFTASPGAHGITPDIDGGAAHVEDAIHAKDDADGGDRECQSGTGKGSVDGCDHEDPCGVGRRDVHGV